MFPRQRERPRQGSFRSPLAYSNRAKANTEPKAHGFDATFVAELDQKYICPVCLTALNEPIQTKCGHRFCKNCLRRVCGSRRYLKCPADNTWLDSQIDLFEDNAMKREILSLEVKCHADTCFWTGELRKLQSHETCCEHVTVDCKNKCGTKVKRSLLANHETLCPQRLEQCHHCKENVCIANMTKHQLLQCMKFPVNCAVCGQTEIIREDIPKHIDVLAGDCPLVVVQCPLSILGCSFEDKRKNMVSHHANSTHNHLQLIVNKLSSQEQIIVEQQEKLAAQEQHLSTAKGSLESLLKECDSLKREITLLRNTQKPQSPVEVGGAESGTSI